MNLNCARAKNLRRFQLRELSKRLYKNFIISNFVNYDNANEVLGDYLFIGEITERSTFDLEELNDDDKVIH